MLAYIFWHVPLAEIDVLEYETALLDFHIDLAAAPPVGLDKSAAYQISEVPWLNGRSGYEDWCFMTSSAVLDTLERLNQNVRMCMQQFPAREISSMGVFTITCTAEQPVFGSRVVWLRRPRGIRYEQAPRGIIDKSKGFLSCGRKRRVCDYWRVFA